MNSVHYQTRINCFQIFGMTNDQDVSIMFVFFSVQAEIDQVKDIMVANIDVIIERGEKLELLVDKTEHLATNSITFR